MKIPRSLILVALVLLVAACRPTMADAYGNFEATEVMVAAEASGRVVRLHVEEGSRVGLADDLDRKSTRLNSSHGGISRMPSSA